MFINKIMELYREACIHGLPVSLSLSHHNGRESFSFTTIPGPDLAGRAESRPPPPGGAGAAFWPPCQVWTRDGGEAKALPAIVVAEGEGDRGTMNTGLP